MEDLLNEKKLMLSLELPDDKSVADLGEDDITFELDLEELMEEPEEGDEAEVPADADDDAVEADAAEEGYEDAHEADLNAGVSVEATEDADETEEGLYMGENLEELDDDEIIEIDENMLRQELARMRALFEGSDEEPQVEERIDDSVTKEVRENRALKQQLATAEQVVQQLKEQLEDLNLFNAKLLYANKLLQNENLTKSQKLNVIKSLDRAESLRETKLLYKSLLESVSTKQKVMNESKHARLGSASRVTRSGGTPKATPELDRWSVLAGLN